MITRRVECPLCVVSNSWKPLEDMGAEGAAFGPVIRVSGRGKKSCQMGGLRSCRGGVKGKGDRGCLDDQLPFPCFNHVPCLPCSCLPFHPACQYITHSDDPAVTVLYILDIFILPLPFSLLLPPPAPPTSRNALHPHSPATLISTSPFDPRSFLLLLLPPCTGPASPLCALLPFVPPFSGISWTVGI